MEYNTSSRHDLLGESFFGKLGCSHASTREMQIKIKFMADYVQFKYREAVESSFEFICAFLQPVGSQQHCNLGHV